MDYFFQFKSHILTAVCGVPQGGHLSPVLFDLFISNVSSVLLYSKFLCFTDNIIIVLKIDIQEDCMYLQNDFDRFVK